MKQYATDVSFLLGLAIAAVGFWMFSPPAAFVVVGVVIMLLSLMWARRGQG